MRTLAIVTLTLATLVGTFSSAGADTSPRQAASRIKAAAKLSPIVTDKLGRFRVELGPFVKGTPHVRRFTISNTRHFTTLGSPAVTVRAGGVAEGVIHLRRDEVTFTGYQPVKKIGR